MKSIKPGRGPSGLGFIGSVFGIIFGIFWTIMAARMGAPAFFPIFGVIFIIMGIVQAAYNYKNATGKNRYSSFDITEDGEEPDPLEQRFGGTEYRDDTAQKSSFTTSSFCPYCGKGVDGDFEYCPKCGKRLPK